MRIIKVLTVFTLLLCFATAGCAKKGGEADGGAEERTAQEVQTEGPVKMTKLVIPEEFKNMMVVYYYENIWSEKEDGSDLRGNFTVINGEPDFYSVTDLLDGLMVSETDETDGRFVADFGFVGIDSSKYQYDFKFAEGDMLFLRNNNGDCSKVEIYGEDYSELKGRIDRLRRNHIFDELVIPDGYNSMIRVNCFANVWSQEEDGTDIVSQLTINSADEEFGVLSDMLDGLRVSEELGNSGSFTADFSFAGDDETVNGYDFVFTAEETLILRCPDGSCRKVEVYGGEYLALLSYINDLRIDFMTRELEPQDMLIGGFGRERELNDEDREIFDGAMADYGTEYEPLNVATQVVAGMNYRFEVREKGLPIDEINESVATYVVIFKPLGDGPPELADVVRVVLH